MSENSMTFDRAVQAAKLRSPSTKVLIPEHNEVFLDIDTDADWQMFLAQMEIVAKEYGPENVSYTFKASRSGPPHRHVRLQLAGAELSPLERIALQACLGSDRKHELLSLIALERGGNPHPTVLFDDNP